MLFFLWQCSPLHPIKVHHILSKASEKGFGHETIGNANFLHLYHIRKVKSSEHVVGRDIVPRQNEGKYIGATNGR